MYTVYIIKKKKIVPVLLSIYFNGTQLFLLNNSTD